MIRFFTNVAGVLAEIARDGFTRIRLLGQSPEQKQFAKEALELVERRLEESKR